MIALNQSVYMPKLFYVLFYKITAFTVVLFVDDERRGRDIYSFLLLPHTRGRIMGRQKEAHWQFRRRSHVSRSKHRAFCRYIHYDR